MRASTPRSRSEPLRLLWRLFGLSDAARTVCVLFGDRMPRQRRASVDSEPKRVLGDFIFGPTSKRIRHHRECGWNQTQTNRGATVTGAGDAGDYAGERGSRSSVAGGSVGATESAEPFSYPGNGRMTQANQSLENSVRFSSLIRAHDFGKRTSVAVRNKPQAKAGQDSPGANGGVWACSVEHFAAPRRAQSRIAKYTRESRIASAAPFAKKS